MQKIIWTKVNFKIDENESPEIKDVETHKFNHFLNAYELFFFQHRIFNSLLYFNYKIKNKEFAPFNLKMITAFKRRNNIFKKYCAEKQ